MQLWKQRKRAHPSFPKELLESLSHLSAVDGLIVIATARTERVPDAIGNARCTRYPLEPFTLDEGQLFILARRPEATQEQIEALIRRSQGNPRVIANLIEPDRSLAGESEIDEKVDLDSLIEQRIDRAITLADEKGTQTGEASGDLSGLAGCFDFGCCN